MIGADKIQAEMVALLNAECLAGRSPHPVIQLAHERFAQNSAEAWFIHVVLNPAFAATSERLRELALIEQMGAVDPMNAFFFGSPNRAFNDLCRATVREAFSKRVHELRTGWRL